MIACDYCSVFWHLDCLNPPMASPPNPAKKWMCPNHIENTVVKGRSQIYIYGFTKESFCNYY
jgi:hypothetical protein